MQLSNIVLVFLFVKTTSVHKKGHPFIQLLPALNMYSNSFVVCSCIICISIWMNLNAYTKVYAFRSNCNLQTKYAYKQSTKELVDALGTESTWIGICPYFILTCCVRNGSELHPMFSSASIWPAENRFHKHTDKGLSGLFSKSQHPHYTVVCQLRPWMTDAWKINSCHFP